MLLQVSMQKLSIFALFFHIFRKLCEGKDDSIFYTSDDIKSKNRDRKAKREFHHTYVFPPLILFMNYKFRILHMGCFKKITRYIAR